MTELGWHGIDRDDPEIVALRAYLEANNGIRGLDVLQPDEIDRAARIFHRDGFVVIADVMDANQLRMLQSGVIEVAEEIVALDAERKGNRGSHRYSFGGSSLTRSMMHRPEWQMLVDLATVTPIVEAIFNSSDYILRSGSGDFCLPGATRYQPLHSDMRDVNPEAPSQFSSFHDSRGLLTTRDLPCPYLCVNFMPFDQTVLNGPTRQIPGTHNSRAPIPNLDEEPEWMRLSTVCPAPAGSVQIRDVRAWHGGTPNLSDDLRAIPNVEFYAPWFREPMQPGISYLDRQKLSAHGQRLTRYHVADSSESLDTGYEVVQLPGSRAKKS